MSCFVLCIVADTPRAPMGEDRASYRREGGPGGADKRGEAGAGATQSFQFVSNFCSDDPLD